MKPILVTSKGRPEAETLKTLGCGALEVAVVVEPQEERQYREAIQANGWRAITVSLPQSGRGLSYARDFALQRMRAERRDFFWMLDDDIKAFYRTRNGKTEKIDAATALREAEGRLLAEPNLGIGSLEYQQYAWNAKAGQTARNSYCDVAVLINANVTANYRPMLRLKVDRDFTLQVLSSGRSTIRLRDLSFSVPKNGSNKGGLHDEYGQGIEESMSRLLEKLWPSIVRYHKKPNGRPDAKIDWGFFRERHSTT
jgi:hypothetical protein